MGQKFVVLIALCFAVLVVDDNNAAEASNLKRLTGKALSAVARWRSKIYLKLTFCRTTYVVFYQPNGSVTRFVETLPLWQNFKSSRRF